MISYTHYKCEICGKESKDKIDILTCEASHYGLSIAEKAEWDDLKKMVKHAGVVVSLIKNEENDRELTNAIETLMKFEDQHGLEHGS